MSEEPKKYNNIPPFVQKRNEFGLLEGIDYVFAPDGRVDWRKMVRQEFLVPNSQKTEETDISKLADSDLLILLAGLKNLADVRGYKLVQFIPSASSDSYCCVACRIEWLPNYETNNESIVFESLGDASPNNTESFGRYYLAAIAENRAFARCVRNFLRINIVSKEEIGHAAKKRGPKGGTSQHAALLQQLMNEKQVTFEMIKEKLLNEAYEGAESISCLEDISKEKLFELINRLKKWKKASTASP